MIMRFSEDDGELIANFFFLGHAQIKSNQIYPHPVVRLI